MTLRIIFDTKSSLEGTGGVPRHLHLFSGIWIFMGWVIMTAEQKRKFLNSPKATDSALKIIISVTDANCLLFTVSIKFEQTYLRTEGKGYAVFTPPKPT